MQFRVSFDQQYDRRQVVQRVIQDFAVFFSLPVHQCTAWHGTVKLHHDETLQQVCG